MSNNSENLITIYMIENNGFIWNADDWYSLRTTHRIMGNLVGTIPSENDDEEDEDGLPSYLLPEEVRLLIEKGVCHAVKYSGNFNSELSIKNDTFRSIIQNQTIDKIKEKVANSKVDFTCTEELYYSKIIDPLPELKENEILRYKVFKDLWSKGFYLTCGIKFGGDFLVYQGDPMIHHAPYIVNCGDLEEKIYVSQSRVSSITKKKMVLAKEDGDSIKYLMYKLSLF